METVDLTDVISAAQEALLDGLHVSMPGKVQAYNDATQTADVVPMVRRMLLDVDGNKVFEDLPVIPNVPIAWQRAGGYCFTMPVSAGDSVLLVFSHVDVGGWRDTGAVADPQDSRRMSLGHPFAIPCIAPDASSLASAATVGLSIGKDGADQRIVIDGSYVKLGASATAFVALADKVDDIFRAYKTYVDAVTACFGTIPAPCVPTGLATYNTAATAAKAAVVSVAATIAKAK